MQGGESAMVELLGRNLQLTAVFAYNDNMAAGAGGVKRATASLRAVCLSIGFDDIPIARYTDPQVDYRALSLCFMAKIATELWRCRGCRRAGYHDTAYADLRCGHSVAWRRAVLITN